MIGKLGLLLVAPQVMAGLVVGMAMTLKMIGMAAVVVVAAASLAARFVKFEAMLAARFMKFEAIRLGWHVHLSWRRPW